MKVKFDFITNSSSTAFIIINKTAKEKSLVDFVRENPQLIEEFKERYSSYKDNPKFSQKDLIKSAKENNRELVPGRNYCIFGDESGTLVGHVFDYILRDGGSSKSFEWKFEEFLR